MPPRKVFDADKARRDVARWGVSWAAMAQNYPRWKFVRLLEEANRQAAAEKAPEPAPAPVPIPTPPPARRAYPPLPVYQVPSRPPGVTHRPQPERAARFTRAEERQVLATVVNHGPMSRTRLLSWQTGMRLPTLDAILASLTADGKLACRDGQYLDAALLSPRARP